MIYPKTTKKNKKDKKVKDFLARTNRDVLYELKNN